MSDELKISKERILEAAAKCSTAKQTLEVLFPEVFKDGAADRTAFKQSLYGFSDYLFGYDLVQIAANDKRALWLNTAYTWKLIPNPSSTGVLLIATRTKK